MPKRDKDKLVCVERQVASRRNETARRFWVAGDNVRPDDKVVANAHNIRPYRYALKAKKPRSYVPCKRGFSKEGRKLASLLARVIEAAQK